LYLGILGTSLCSNGTNVNTRDSLGCSRSYFKVKNVPDAERFVDERRHGKERLYDMDTSHERFKL
jgi:hypothetical protein